MVYEIKNNCTLQFSPRVPFIECKVFDNFVLKPLILLYPNFDTHIDISLSYISGFFATFPEYDPSKKGWSVLAHPDGTLIDQ
jgi:hypothetical protein